MAIRINNKVKVFTLIIGEEEVCRNTDMAVDYWN